MELNNCTALITGASSGIGRELARQLAGRARTLILVARRQARLEEVRDELKKRTPQLDVRIHVADLIKPGAIETLCESLGEEKIAVDLLINNAGVGDLGDFSEIDPERLTAILELNIVALTSLTRRLLPAMITQKRGAILNVSSCASFIPMPRMAIYAASKAYVTSFSEALHAEVRVSGVSVTALCPGPVHTEFNDRARRANQEGDLAPEFTYVAPETVAQLALAGIARNQPIVIPGVVMKLAMACARLLPMPLLRLGFRFSR